MLWQTAAPNQRSVGQSCPGDGLGLRQHRHLLQLHLLWASSRRWPLLRMQFVVDVLLSPLVEAKERCGCVQVTDALAFVNVSVLLPELSLEPKQRQPA